MLDTLSQLAKANPLLVGGIGTVLFGSVMYIVRGIPNWVYGALKRWMTIDILLNTESVLYHEILEVVSRHRIAAFARCYTTDRNGEFVAGFGRSVAKFFGSFVIFNRELIEKNLRLDEKLHITIFSRNVDVLRQIIVEARKPKVDGRIKIYTSASGYWHSPVKRKKRDLDTVFVNGGIKAKIVERIEWFLENEEWYIQRGIPYKLIFLLHGPPGTGKSSLIYSLASRFERGLSSISSVNSIDDNLRNLPENTFAVIEDIDMISTARGTDDKEASSPAPQPSQVTLAKEIQLAALQILINTMDGFSTPHGLIMFVTTNHKDRLDAAMVRSSRIDHDIEIGPLNAETIEAMYVAFYGDGKRKLIRRWVESSGFMPRTGADLQAIFMTASAEAAIERLAVAQSGNVIPIHGHE